MSADSKQDVIDLIDMYCKGGGTIENARKMARRAYSSSPELVDEAIKALEKMRLAIRELDDPITIKDKDIIAPWYTGPLKSHVFWPGTRDAMLDSGFPPDAMKLGVEQPSSKIVSLIKPPGEPKIDSRGLVLGYVQSGKTTNFTSVIAKAADAGYRLFVVLAGMHDSLRTQTQDRLERDLIAPCESRWYNLTHDGDFDNPGNANTFLGDVDKRCIAIVKKNPARLKRLFRWLHTASEDTLRGCPILVIDDEADQASIDVGKSRRSTINQRILDLLDTRKGAYIAYTATPFANLLIDPDSGNLYPRDFIVDLPKPDGHFGTDVVFGREPLVEGEEPFDGLGIVRPIPLEDIAGLRAPTNREKREQWAPEAPESLRVAVRYFVLATAARLARGHAEHSSMLIHTSFYVDAQERMKPEIVSILDSIRSEAKTKQGLESLERLWTQEVEGFDYEALEPYVAKEVPVPVLFDALSKQLSATLDSVEVIVDNSKSQERLSYGEEPQTVIAIGGNTLSRGLTLEGLVVSYFVRSASAYDTLLQMGRWFGYRGGYEDLPRMWMSSELEDWFIHLATVEQEIRTDIARYAAEHKTPMELAVKIRQHPKMVVTARAKMRDAVATKVSYSGERLQTFMFNHKDKGELLCNQDAARELLKSASEQGKVFADSPRKGWWSVRGVSNEAVIRFLEAYQFHPSHADLQAEPMVKYINAQANKGALERWNVVVAGHEPERYGSIELGLPKPVGMIIRSKLNIAGLPHANIKALMSKVDRVADLDPQPDGVTKMGPAKLQKKRPSGEGLVVLYPIQAASNPAGTGRVRSKRVALDADEDVIGMGIVFPTASESTPQKYVSAFVTPDDLEDSQAEVEEQLREIDEADAATLEATQSDG